MISTIKNKYSSRGFSLVEVIVYIALLSILIGAITWSLGSVLHSYNKMKDERALESSAIISMDRMIKEIRNSKSVDLAHSATSTSDGYLTLNGYDSNGSSTVIKFYRSNNRIYIDQGGVQLGPLTLENIEVPSLVFRYFTNASSTGVKIELGLQSSSSTLINYFYDSAILRNSYQN
ncbi:MAG: prepilin-type N-terminal cleavage/methylation domain-containing protein [Candidatus Paceibacterota bacterium]